MTEVIGPDQVARAAKALADGRLVAFPTETVYGLGGDASNPAAVAAIFEAKGRPADHPLIVHLGSAKQLDDWARADARAHILADAFWPGPLTLVVPRTDRVCAGAVGDRPTVGLRVPDHPLTLELLAQFGGGVAGPSANRFGHVSPTKAAHVMHDLDGRVDLVLDGGPSSVGLESTILELADGSPTLLRPGAVTVDELTEALGEEIIDGRAGVSRAAGMMDSHYAPKATVSLLAQDEEPQLTDATFVISAGPFQTTEVPSERLLILGPDAGSFGHSLYEALRAADAAGADRIVIVPPRDGALLPAVLDRLVKAAGPRG